MASILIAIIYLAFVSMGLPDALLGSAWPTIYGSMGVPVSWAGFVTIIMAGGTVVSSLLSDGLLRRFGTGLVTVVSTLMTAVALFGFSVSSAFWHLILWAIPYGLGAGSIDAALNNYVALKYKSRHMSWIHFFWGVGATAGPVIMGGILSGGAAWTSGYRTVGLIQAAMTLALFLSLPLWKKNDLPQPGKSESAGRMTRGQVLKLPGAKALLVAFFCYSSVEATAGLWASSYMTLQRGVPPETAARWASIFYLGITLGRFAIGFITDRVGDRNMIRIGQGCIILGVLTMLFSGSNSVTFAGLILAGLGCAPVYPCLLHETPVNFGAENSQTMMGFQMACAYTGSTVMPPLFGLIAGHVSIGLYPLYLLLFAVTMLLTAERMNRAGKK